MQALLNIALRAARDGASVLTGNFDRLDRVKRLEERADGPLTSTHLDVEQAMLLQLQKTFPKHGYQSSASQLPAAGDSGTVWILDPLIGIANFLRGAPGFLLGLSCKVDGQLKLAVLLDPLQNEEFTAIRGTGASLNGRRIRVGTQSKLEGSVIAMDFDGSLDRQQLTLTLDRLLERGCAIRSSGNAILDLANLAAGRLDGSIIATPSATPLATAALLLREAGGLISDSEGNPQLSGDQLVSANPKLFKQLLQLARPAQ